jgi:hypothetical protein
LARRLLEALFGFPGDFTYEPSASLSPAEIVLPPEIDANLTNDPGA